MRQAVLSDETWASLDPRAGSLRRKDLLRLRIGLFVASAVVVALGVVWWSGIVVPHLAGAGVGASADAARHTFSLQQDIVNRGWHTEQVIEVGRSGPGLELDHVQGVPQALAPGGSATVEVFYRVTDCAAVPSGAWPVPIRVHRVWGSMTTRMQPEGMSQMDADDDTMLPWQVALARTACGSGTMAP